MRTKKWTIKGGNYVVKERIRVVAPVCPLTDGYPLVEITFPSVKDDTNPKMDGVSLEHFSPGKPLEYVSILSFCCPVKPKEANIPYKEVVGIDALSKDVAEDVVTVSVVQVGLSREF